MNSQEIIRQSRLNYFNWRFMVFKQLLRKTLFLRKRRYKTCSVECILYCHLVKLFLCEALAQFVNQDTNQERIQPWTNQSFNIRDGWTSKFVILGNSYDSFLWLTQLHGSGILFSGVLKNMHCGGFFLCKTTFKYLHQNFLSIRDTMKADENTLHPLGQYPLGKRSNQIHT